MKDPVRHPKLYICSNSGPARPAEPGAPLRSGASGGLVPHLLALLDAYGGEWFFPEPAPSSTEWPEQAGKIVPHPVPIARELHTPHYETISIETLLWMFHYLHETSSSPAFDKRILDAWAAYRQVNDLLAEQIASSLVTAAGQDAVVLVNDYHFLLVPGAMTGQSQASGAHIIYAHQVPWCEPDYFGILPAAVRDQVLTSLLSCHSIVFHSRRWLEAFSRCCDRYMADASIVDDTVERHGHRTRLHALPFPLDTATVLQLQSGEAAQHWRQRFSESAKGRRLLVRVDRLDLWKNHLRGFAAFEAVLARHPRLADELCFLAVTAPVRHQSARHRAYEAACRAAADRINDAWPGRIAPVTVTGPGWPRETRARALAALSEADAVLVNPIFDGFNLVAKEAALLGERGTLLLSRNAGAYEYLSPGVTPIDPFDVAGTADMLEAAIIDGARPDPSRTAAVREAVRRDNAADWLTAALDEGGEYVG